MSGGPGARLRRFLPRLVTRPERTPGKCRPFRRCIPQRQRRREQHWHGVGPGSGAAHLRFRPIRDARGQLTGNVVPPLNPGSSPHARGAVAHAGRDPVRVGIILACAGSRGVPGRSRRWSRDHPRMRGGRTRWARACRAPRDHPRMRGEQVPTGDFEAPAKGPSPRARGADLVDAYGRAVGRTIPAYAQSRSLGIAQACAAGPCPRARGAVHPRAGPLRPLGTIPTGAGGSRCRRRQVSRSWDHPRGRGEQRSFIVTNKTGAGAPLRARAWSRTPVPLPRCRAVLPAPAGSRAWVQGAVSGPGDHPRMRGEQGEGADWPLSGKGPSPRARGAARTQRLATHQSGAIPARVGSRFTDLRPYRVPRSEIRHFHGIGHSRYG